LRTFYFLICESVICFFNVASLRELCVGVAMNLCRENFRSMIFYDFRCGLSQQESCQRLKLAFGDEAPSRSSVYAWFGEFKRGRDHLHDDVREGRPATAVTESNINTVRQLIESDKKITCQQIRDLLGIGMSQVQTILHVHLKVRKLCTRWIPHDLTEDQKRLRVEWCRKMMKKFDGGQSLAVYNIVTGDETWVYCFEPERKSQSAEWVFPFEDLPTKVKKSRSTDKKMVA
jgi:histone-lysine N-methyltransferase SETMAR